MIKTNLLVMIVIVFTLVNVVLTTMNITWIHSKKEIVSFFNSEEFSKQDLDELKKVMDLTIVPLLRERLAMEIFGKSGEDRQQVAIALTEMVKELTKQDPDEKKIKLHMKVWNDFRNKSGY